MKHLTQCALSGLLLSVALLLPHAVAGEAAEGKAAEGKPAEAHAADAANPAQPAEADANSAPPSPLDILKESGIAIDAAKGEVRVEAKVCLDRGILEFLVCRASGEESFEHESIFSTKCLPSLLHLSLLAIGLEPLEFDGSRDWERRAKAAPKSLTLIEVEYEHEGKKTRRNVSELLKPREGAERAAPDYWVFTGSYWRERKGKRVYSADRDGMVVGLGMEPSSVLQIPALLGNPYESEDRGMEIDEKKVPPRETPVQLIFSAYKPKPAGDAAPQPAPATGPQK